MPIQKSTNSFSNMHNKEFGNNGETLAVKYLEEKGYLILDRNFKFGRVGEVDIIAKDGECLVFVEVKTRSNHSFGLPIMSISKKKVASWQRASEGYMLKNNIKNTECRMDLLAIDMIGKKIQIEHVVNAVY